MPPSRHRAGRRFRIRKLELPGGGAKRMSRNPRLWLGLVVALLAVAVGAQVIGWSRQREQLRPPDLGALFPRELPGWQVRDVPLAETPDQIKNVEGILQFDGALCRIYRRGNQEISVYVSYWLPGKVPASLIDAHVPDICWVDNGWSMTKQPALAPRETGKKTVPVPNCREFESGSQRLQVAFWHVSGHELRAQVGVAEAALSLRERIARRWVQVCRAIMTAPGEQLFLRVSTTADLDTGLDTEPGRACVELLGRVLHGENLYRDGN